jgi:hypothetical protein
VTVARKVYTKLVSSMILNLSLFWNVNRNQALRRMMRYAIYRCDCRR